MIFIAGLKEGSGSSQQGHFISFDGCAPCPEIIGSSGGRNTQNKHRASSAGPHNQTKDLLKTTVYVLQLLVKSQGVGAASGG